MKIIDKVNRIYEEGGTTVSFEFFPAKTEAGVFNLLNRVEQMGFALNPTFVTLTWRSAFKDEKLWLKIGSHIQNEFNIDVLLHLTCHLPKDKLRNIVQAARDAGIQNILALRGDPPIGADAWEPVPNGFKNAKELISMIREEHGDYFCIACAGYPEVHTESWNHPTLPPSQQAKTRDLHRLKEKQDAGADFVISQFFFDVDNVINWVKECREVAGITIPILPGYLPIQNYNSFKKFTSWCKTSVPTRILETLNTIRNDDAAVKEFGVTLGVETCQQLMASGICSSLHFYTMNLATMVTKILRELDLIPSSTNRSLPWKNMIAPLRESRSRKNRYEEIRPIFWSNRESSYIARTSEWDDFPNGRWGNRKSPAYGDLSEYYLAYKRPKVDRKLMWGEPLIESDVWDTFVKFIDGQVPTLPWCEQSLSGESVSISENLRWINSMGFLTINSQPRVNGASSSHPTYGWGGDDGYVFQKAYVEFFTTPELMSRLLKALKDYPSLSYHAVNMAGQEYSDTPESTVNAVTWGVFPGKEVMQPTVVDSASFLAWKNEAFELWLAQWGSAYEESSDASKVIKNIYDTYYLVNIVDNDYAVSEDEENNDIFSIFKRVITEHMSNEELRSRLCEVENRNKKLQETVLKLNELHLEAAKDLEETNAKLAAERSEINKLRAEVRSLQMNMINQ